MLVGVPADADEGSAGRAAVEIVGLGRGAEDECLGAGAQFEVPGAIGDAGIAVEQVEAMGQHETGYVGFKAEVASGVLVNAHSQSRWYLRFRALRRVRLDRSCGPLRA